jgi:hypothetical protein
MEELLVNLPDYWRTPVKPRGFAEFCDMVETGGKITGIWELASVDPKTGQVKQRTWNHNAVTDHGAVNILASAIASASNASQWNDILITNNSGSTTLTTALTNGQVGVTSLAVASIPASITLDYPAPINTTPTQLQIGYGTGQTQTVTVGSAASQNATSITVSSFTSNAAYAIGTNVVPLPNVGENPSNANLTANATSALSQYSGALSSGAFTYNATTGAGNRNVVITYTFANSTNGGTTPNGSYTDAWLVNVSSGATNTTSGNFVGNYICHEINNALPVNNSNNLQVTITIKI